MTSNTNEGEQALPVSEGDVDSSVLTKSNILEPVVRVESSYKKPVDASMCVCFPE